MYRCVSGGVLFVCMYCLCVTCLTLHNNNGILHTLDFSPCSIFLMSFHRTFDVPGAGTPSIAANSSTICGLLFFQAVDS